MNKTENENEIVGRIKIGHPGNYEWSLVRRREGVLWYFVGATAHNPDGCATLAPDLHDRIQPLPPVEWHYDDLGFRVLNSLGVTNGQ